MIDILLPFYGDPEYLRLAVRSVLSQTVPDWRLIVVDDGYPDLTLGQWFLELDDERVEYHRNPRNLGANATYRSALERATASHVTFMGADDVMLPLHIQTLSRSIEAVAGSGVYTCGVEVIDEQGHTTLPTGDRVKRFLTPGPMRRVGGGYITVSGEPAVTTLMHGNWTYFPALCWDRALVTDIGFRTDYHVVQDLALLVDVLLADAPLTMATETTFQYRRHATSDSAARTYAGGSRFAEESAYYRMIAEVLTASGMHRAARAARLRATHRAHLVVAATRSSRRGDLRGASRLLQQVVSRG